MRTQVIGKAIALLALPVALFITACDPTAISGSGDVLTGLLTGLLAQGYTPRDACLLGVYLHGLAGDLAAAAHSQPGMTAGDLASFVAQAWTKIWEAA